MISVQEFVDKYGITIKSEPWPSNPSPGWERWPADHWKCVLRCNSKRMTCYFSKGFGHKRKAPDVCEVLSSIAQDAAGIENAQSFEDWCSDYGYEYDEEARQIYHLVEKYARELERFLADNDIFEELLWEVEPE